MPELELAALSASLTLDTTPTSVLTLSGEGGTVTLQLQPAVTPELELGGAQPTLTLDETPLPVSLAGAVPQLALHGETGSVVMDMYPLLRGPEGPPGPPGDGSTSLGGYPVQVTDPTVYDLLQFQDGAWINSPITDGGNF